MAVTVLEIDDDSFDDCICEGVALVEFYGTYCPPCKLLEPVLEKLAQDYANRVVVAKINIDEHSEAAVDYTVDDIPTLVFFKDGEETSRLFGAQKVETMAEVLDRLLS